MASKNLEVERDDFLNSLDSIIVQSDSEVEIVEEVTSRKRRRVKCGGLNKDLNFLDESSTDDEVTVIEQFKEKISKKCFIKKREVRKTIKLTEQKVSKCHKLKNQGRSEKTSFVAKREDKTPVVSKRKDKTPVVAKREDNTVKIQGSRSIRNFNTDTLPPNYLKILMVACYKDTIEEVYAWSDQWGQSVPK